MPDPRPFAGAAWCSVVLPDRAGDPFNPIDQFCQLLVNESAELEAELGCPVRFGDAGGPRLFIGPATENPGLMEHLRSAGLPTTDEPVVWLEPDQEFAIVDGPDLAGTGDAFQLLRTAIRTGARETRPTSPSTPGDIIDTLLTEVPATWPAIAERGIDWGAAVERHRPGIVASGASLPSLQRLMATLGDAHSAARDPATNARLPYRAWIDGDTAHFTHVPTWSAGWAAGCRPGDAIVGVDACDWWERSGATPRSRAAVAGYRWLAGSVGETRTFHVNRQDGTGITWSETYQPAPWLSPVDWHIRPSGSGYLRIRGWLMSPTWIEALDSALRALSACPRLIVDLRGNIGGQLIAAQHFRDRFLTERTDLGTICFSLVHGGLSTASTMAGEPVRDRPCWRNPTRFLIDRQTYSASEDAILGLGGLPHVQIVGEPSGGGSGRPRTLALGTGTQATVSTALTSDRTGRVIEEAGIPVDIDLPIDAAFRDPREMPAAQILDMADRLW
jgi:carboxyl-terminal processing protease